MVSHFFAVSESGFLSAFFLRLFLMIRETILIITRASMITRMIFIAPYIITSILPITELNALTMLSHNSVKKFISKKSKILPFIFNFYYTAKGKKRKLFNCIKYFNFRKKICIAILCLQISIDMSFLSVKIIIYPNTAQYFGGNMAIYKGKTYTKKELLSYVGSMDSIAGVRRSELIAGKGDTLKICDVTSGDISFTVMESKNLDMLDFKYKGVPFNLSSRVGAISNENSDNSGFNFLRAVAGGMIYSAGYSNCGMFNDTEPFHGRIRNEPVRNLKVTSEWDADEYVLGVEGESRDAGLFGPNISSTRKISTKLGSKSVNFKTVIENQGFKEEPFQILYHINNGFPIVDEGAKVYIPSYSEETQNDEAKKYFESRFDIVKPDLKYNEQLVFNKLLCDENGYAHVGIYNPELKLGLEAAFNVDVLPNVIEWKCMGCGCYVLGFLVTNNHSSGVDFERENGTLEFIAPFEQKISDITFTVLDGDADLNAFMERFNACTVKK